VLKCKSLSKFSLSESKEGISYLLLNETSVNINLHRMANEMEILPRRSENYMGLEYSHLNLRS